MVSRACGFSLATKVDSIGPPGVTHSARVGRLSKAMVFMAISALSGGVTTHTHSTPECEKAAHALYIKMRRSEFPRSVGWGEGKTRCLGKRPTPKGRVSH